MEGYSTENAEPEGVNTEGITGDIHANQPTERAWVGDISPNQPTDPTPVEGGSPSPEAGRAGTGPC